MIEYITEYFATFDFVKACDLAGFIIGLVYLWLEYKASIWLWLASVIMPIVHGYTYLARGLYADFGMEFYYVLAAVYGFAMWQWGKAKDKKERPITHASRRTMAGMIAAVAVIWVAIYAFLLKCTDSTVPGYDAFTTAMSIVALWSLAQKHVEQWLFWLVVDALCTVLYVYKQIPFSGVLYGFYTVMAIAGYYKWKSMATCETDDNPQPSNHPL